MNKILFPFLMFMVGPALAAPFSPTLPGLSEAEVIAIVDEQVASTSTVLGADLEAIKVSTGANATAAASAQVTADAALPVAGGTMTGVLTIIQGNLGATAISFPGDLNTGIAQLNPGEVSIIAEGLERMRFGLFGAQLKSGILAIPLGSAASPPFSLESNNSGIFFPDANSLAISANGTESVRFETTGITLTGQLNFSGGALQHDISLTVPAHSEGLVYYDKNEKTISHFNEELDVTINLGQEMVVRVVNETGSTILDGKAVHPPNSSAGGLPSIQLSKADDAVAANVIGLATHDIEAGTTGYVTAFGIVRNIDTSSFSIGDKLFLSDSSAGELTNTAPLPPSFEVQIGIVIVSDVSNGKILVSVNQPILGATANSAVLSATQAFTGSNTFANPVTLVGSSLTISGTGAAMRVDGPIISSGTLSIFSTVDVSTHPLIKFTNATGSDLGAWTDQGRLGVGTFTPDDTLHVAGGNILLDNDKAFKIKDAAGSSRKVLTLESTDDLTIGSSSNDDLIFKVGTLSEALRIKDVTGNVGIGTANPNAKLDIVGNLTITGTVDEVDISDQFATVAVDTITLQTNIDGKVAKTGDTMTGDLIVEADVSITGGDLILGGTFFITPGGHEIKNLDSGNLSLILGKGDGAGEKAFLFVQSTASFNETRMVETGIVLIARGDGSSFGTPGANMTAAFKLTADGKIVIGWGDEDGQNPEFTPGLFFANIIDASPLTFGNTYFSVVANSSNLDATAIVNGILKTTSMTVEGNILLNDTLDEFLPTIRGPGGAGLNWGAVGAGEMYVSIGGVHQATFSSSGLTVTGTMASTFVTSVFITSFADLDVFGNTRIGGDTFVGGNHTTSGTVQATTIVAENGVFSSATGDVLVVSSGAAPSQKLWIFQSGGDLLPGTSGQQNIGSADSPIKEIFLSGQSLNFVNASGVVTSSLSVSGSGDLLFDGVTVADSSGDLDIESSELPSDGYASTYVNASGDNMTGQLTLDGSSLTVTGSAFSVGGSVLKVTGGRVGVGTISPSTALHIKANTPGTVGSAPAGQVIIQALGTSLNSNAVVTGYNSNGAGAPSEQLWYWGNSSGSNSNVTLLNRINASLTLGTNNTTRLTILGSGNVGINESNPEVLLEVNGSAMFGSGATKSTITATGQVILVNEADCLAVDPDDGGQLCFDGSLYISTAPGGDMNQIPIEGITFAFGTIHISSDAAAETTLSANTFIKAAGTCNSGRLVAFTADTNCELTYTGMATIDAEVVATASFVKTAGGATVGWFRLVKNGDPSTGFECQSKTSLANTSDVEHITVVCDFLLATNDTVTLYVMTEDGDNLKLDTMTVIAKE